MTLAEIALLLFLVIDPFGNLPFVLAILKNLDAAAYRRAIMRELSFAFGVLLLFALGGAGILDHLGVEQASLAVAGGVILFLISLGMIFGSATEIFRGDYGNNPLLVPIAVPSVAGPSAITVVIVLRTREQVPLEPVLWALALVFLLTLGVFLAGRGLSRRLGSRGLAAVEKFMGLLLNLIAVDMILGGIRDFLLP